MLNRALFSRHGCCMLALLCSLISYAQRQDTRTRVFDENFRTLKVQVEDNFYAPPVISMTSGQHILISFDEMGDDRRYMRYTLIHCDEHWQPDNLLESEYVEGFNEAEVTDYAFSQSTFRHYVNYRITIPSADMRPLISGNYLLRVYDESDPDATLLQARFCISDESVRLTGAVTTQTDRGSNTSWQQLELQILNGQYSIRDPYQDLYLVIEQNGVEQPGSSSLKPMRVEPGKLIYEHNPALIFPAGNEFRRFETVRTNYNGMHIESSRYEGDGYSATLITDKERASRPYTYDKTQHGRFKIDSYDATDPDLGADYVNTRFTLDFPRIMNGDVYVDGEFTHHLIDDTYKMRYDEHTGLYTLDLPLKQGSYNYRYIARNNAGELSPALVEGDRYETSNEYTVKVFHRPPGQRYSKLIGVATLHN